MNGTTPTLLEGWKAIANHLGVHINTVQRWARRDRDPLPVRVNHKGPYVATAAADAWAGRQDLPLQSHDEIKALRAEVGALRSAKVGRGAVTIPRPEKRSARA